MAFRREYHRGPRRPPAPVRQARGRRASCLVRPDLGATAPRWNRDPRSRSGSGDDTRAFPRSGPKTARSGSRAEGITNLGDHGADKGDVLRRHMILVAMNLSFADLASRVIRDAGGP